MTADFGMLGRLQRNEQRIEDSDHVAPAASPLARLVGGASTGDLSLLGTRISRRQKVSSCSDDLDAVISASSLPVDTPLPFRHNDQIPSQSGKKRSSLSPFAGRGIRDERSSEAEILKFTQEATEIPLGRSKVKNLESENDLGLEHSKGVISPKKRSSARTVNLKYSNHRPASPKSWISPATATTTSANSTMLPTRTLFIGNLSSDADKSSVEDLFAPYGVVLGVRIPTDSETGKHKGFGYVEFVTTSEATAALNKAQGTYLKGRRLHLDFSQTIVNPRSPWKTESLDRWLSDESSIEADERKGISLEELCDVFEEIPPEARDPRFGSPPVQCIFCNKQVRNTAGGQRKHLRVCQTYSQSEKGRTVEKYIPQFFDAEQSLPQVFDVFGDFNPETDPPSQIFMHYTISEDRCGDDDALRGSILARLGTKRENEQS